MQGARQLLGITGRRKAGRSQKSRNKIVKNTEGGGIWGVVLTESGSKSLSTNSLWLSSYLAWM